MTAELTTRDLRTVLGIVRVLSAADGLPEFRDLVPGLALTAVPGSLAAYNEVDLDTGDAFGTYAPDGGDAWTPDRADRFPRYALDHPTLQHIARTGDGSAVTISDVLARDAYRATRLYRELFAEMGVEDQIVIGLPAPRPVMIGVPINRDVWGFQPRDRAVLDELRPHLAQAHAAAATRDYLRAALASRDAVLESAGRGVIRLQGGHPVDASPIARRWLDRGLLDGGAFAEDLRGWYLRERARLSIDDELPALAEPFRVSGADAQVAMRLIDAETIVLSESPSGAPPIEELRRLGLTGAEAAVLRLVVAGSSTGDIAGALHITPDTVRKHLQRVFRKLGVHSRAAAVAIALGAGPRS
jgi:DNA-binding CsgD family transcriptional regulator